MFNAYSRAAIRQLNDGINGGELCVPCQIALEEDERTGFASIGTSAWLNNGFREYDEYQHLTEPVLYCDCCRHVLRAREFQRRQGRDQSPSVDAQKYPGDFNGLTTCVFLHDDDLDSQEWEAALNDFKVQKPEYSRTVRHHWADVELIKSWLDDCEKDHGPACNEHQTSATDTGSLLLLDVIDDCLAVGNFKDQYFALSYVWGASKQFLTLMENYDQLRQPGTLSKQPLTNTIKDAMTFVKSLGERYLWVDTIVGEFSMIHRGLHLRNPVHNPR